MPCSRYLFLFVLIINTLLQGCGFALRGNADLAFHKLFIQGANLSFKRDFVKLLKVNNVEIVDKQEQAEVMVEFIREQSLQNILSISSGGTVNEYQLLYTVTYRIKGVNDELWSDVQTIQNKRDFTFDNTQLLAKQYEQERLKENMREDAVRTIMRHLILFKPTKK